MAKIRPLLEEFTAQDARDFAKQSRRANVMSSILAAAEVGREFVTAEGPGSEYEYLISLGYKLVERTNSVSGKPYTIISW